MKDIGSLNEVLAKLLSDNGYKLFDVENLKEEDNDILRVVVDNHLDLEEMTKLSEIISNFMDEYDKSDDPYLLDVTSVGLERPLRNDEEIKAALGSYVFIKMRNEVDGLKKVEGDLIEVNDDEIKLTYKAKNITKKMVISKDNLKFIRLAVKF